MDEHWFRLPILSPRHWTPNVLWLCQRADVTASVAASRGRPQPWRKADRGTAPIAVAARLGISEEEGSLLGGRSVR